MDPAGPAAGLTGAPSEALRRLAASPRPRVLFVSHAGEGGVRRHIDELAEALHDAAEVLLIQPRWPHFIELRWLRAGESLALWFHRDEQWALLVSLFAALGVARVHVHHVHGLPEAVLELPAQLGCPYDVTLHDFFPACPAYHLTGADERYCGNGAGCQRCTEAGPAQWGLSIPAWRARFGPWLAGAARAIAPSEASARRLNGFFPEARLQVWPHAQRARPAEAVPVRVLVPGAISPAKGVDVLEACARDAAARGLPLHFRVLGFLSRPIAQWPELPLSIAGQYPEGRLEALMAIERGDAFFFPAQCPESFSYTLSSALDTGLPIVATDLGALPERLAERPNARVLAWDSPAAALNDALVACAPAPKPIAAREDTFPAYARRYMAPLREPFVPKPRPAMPPLPASVASEPAPNPGGWTLAALFRDGVGCGRGSSLDELRRRAALADGELERAARLAAEADGLRREIERMRASRSWRLTAPLRSALRFVGRLARGEH